MPYLITEITAMRKAMRASGRRWSRLVLGVISACLALEVAAVEIESSVDGAAVLVDVPAESIAVGAKARFGVTVTPAAGQPTPSTIRGRFGMPDHGHWVTEEEAHDAQSPAPLAFTGEFPMHGRYRFRIWIDYPDGRTVKTAIDLWLEPERAIEPVVVP